MPREIRRIVTGHDADGNAVCVSDAAATNILQSPKRPGVALTNLWQTTTTPAEYDGAEETVDAPLVLQPPRHGSVFRIIEFEPEDPEVMKTLDGKAAFAHMGAANNIAEQQRHPFMHKTESVDYVIVLEGEITMLMDHAKDDVHLKAGDVMVQRGTNHAWSNQGTETCRIAFILIDGVAKTDAGAAS